MRKLIFDKYGLKTKDPTLEELEHTLEYMNRMQEKSLQSPYCDLNKKVMNRSVKIDSVKREILILKKKEGKE